MRADTTFWHGGLAIHVILVVIVYVVEHESSTQKWREIAELKEQLTSCQHALETVSVKLTETEQRASESDHFCQEMEAALEEERRHCRLKVLETKEEVRDRAERTLDDLRAERERLHREFEHGLAAKDAEIANLRNQLEAVARGPRVRTPCRGVS